MSVHHLSANHFPCLGIRGVEENQESSFHLLGITSPFLEGSGQGAEVEGAQVWEHRQTHVHVPAAPLHHERSVLLQLTITGKAKGSLKRGGLIGLTW